MAAISLPEVRPIAKKRLATGGVHVWFWWLRGGTAPAACGIRRRSIGGAEAVGVDLVGLAEPAEQLNLTREWVKPLRHLREWIG